MKILIIYTGGTIGMVKDPQSGVLKPLDFEQIRENVPELKRLGYQLDVHSFHPPIDSSDMKPETWQSLAELIQQKYAAYEGFVILHGSDTMAYTASALSFMLEGLAKPVVLTGSQLPIGEIRNDARENLIAAIEVAALQENGQPLVPEVCIYFDYLLLRGNRTSKVHASRFEAFHSPNYPALAEAGVRIRLNAPAVRTATLNQSLTINTRWKESVGSIKLFPGMSKAALKAVLLTPEIDAVVMEAFGAGNGPTETWFIELLQQAIDGGKVIVDITQCRAGSVELGRYETSSQLKTIGVLSGRDITYEAAVTKLMFLLGQGHTGEKLKQSFLQDICGEITLN